MLPELIFPLTIAADIAVFLFVVYYLFRLRGREKKIEKKEETADSNYHHVVDEALSKERQILSDATTEADQIITGAQYINAAAKEEVTKALKQVVADIENEGKTISIAFTKDYDNSLNKITKDSLQQFEAVSQNLQKDLQNQITQVHQTLLPNLEKELEAYKEERLKDIKMLVENVVEKAAREILNKSVSLTDHQQLVIEALERAKKEGMFG